MDKKTVIARSVEMKPNFHVASAREKGALAFQIYGKNGAGLWSQS